MKLLERLRRALTGEKQEEASEVKSQEEPEPEQHINPATGLPSSKPPEQKEKP